MLANKTLISFQENESKSALKEIIVCIKVNPDTIGK